MKAPRGTKNVASIDLVWYDLPLHLREFMSDRMLPFCKNKKLHLLSPIVPYKNVNVYRTGPPGSIPCPSVNPKFQVHIFHEKRLKHIAFVKDSRVGGLLAVALGCDSRLSSLPRNQIHEWLYSMKDHSAFLSWKSGLTADTISSPDVSSDDTTMPVVRNRDLFERSITTAIENMDQESSVLKREQVQALVVASSCIVGCPDLCVSPSSVNKVCQILESVLQQRKGGGWKKEFLIFLLRTGSAKEHLLQNADNTPCSAQ